MIVYIEDDRPSANIIKPYSAQSAYELFMWHLRIIHKINPLPAILYFMMLQCDDIEKRLHMNVLTMGWILHWRCQNVDVVLGEKVPCIMLADDKNPFTSGYNQDCRWIT